MSRYFKLALLIACLIGCTSGKTFDEGDASEPKKDSTAQAEQKLKLDEEADLKTFKDYEKHFKNEMKSYMGRYRAATTKEAKQEEFANRPMIKPFQLELTELLESSSVSDETKKGVQWWYRKARVEDHEDVVLRLILENFAEAEFIEEHIHKLPYDLPHAEIEKYLRSILASNTFDTAEGEKAEMVKAELKSLKDTLLTKHADEENINGIKLTELVEAQEFESKLQIGKPVPDIVDQDLGGVEFKLSDYRGKVTMISFWGFWWGACLELFPHERSLVEQLSDKPFALIGVNSDGDREEAFASAKKRDVPWRNFWNGEDGVMGPISVKWSVYSWPAIYLIDAKGIIRYKNVRGAELDEAITKLMAEAGHEVELMDEEEMKAKVKEMEEEKAATEGKETQEKE